MRMAGDGSDERPNAEAMTPQPVLRRSGNVNPAWLPGDAETWKGEVPRGGDGRVDVGTLIAAQAWEQDEPLVVVISDDLRAKGCESLFGFATPRARVAVVSTYRLQGEGDERLRARLAKVIAHEWMHLAGRRHCRAQGCLMHPVSTVEELDARGDVLCRRCRSDRPMPAWRRWWAWPWKGAAASVAAVAILSLGMDATVNALRARERPFQTRVTGSEAAVYFRSEQVVRFGVENAQAEERARQTEAALNRLFAAIDPPHLRPRRDGSVTEIDAAGAPVLTVDMGVSGGREPEAFARDWVAKWDPLLQAKGRPHESCPDCHVRRRAQVREAVLRPPRFWR